jgi:nucleoid-associated protein YgaU
MRYAVTGLLLLALAVVGCKKQNKGPVMTTTEPPPQTTLEPIPPPETSTETTPLPAPVVMPPPPPHYEPSPPPAPSPAVNTYTVQKGDTLWSIALRFLGDGKRWREIVEANPGLEPSKLRIGQVIILPPK